MKKTTAKNLGRICLAVLLVLLLTPNCKLAAAATKAIYEYGAVAENASVYRGVVNVEGLNIRTGAGKTNPQLTYRDENVVLNMNDEVAILDQELSGSDIWYKISFQKDETILIGYAYGNYISLTVDKVTPLPTPSPVPTATPTPVPPTKEPTKAPITPTVVPTEPVKEANDGNGLVIAIVVVAILGVGIIVALWYLKRREDQVKGTQAKEKLDRLKQVPITNAPLSPNGTPIPVRRRRGETEPDESDQKKTGRLTPQEEATILAAKERARILNEEMIRQNQIGGNEEEEEKLREMVEAMKEKEILKEEIDRLRIGDMVYHEYFRKGIVRDNSDVKVIEISFGQDVRFLNKASCASKRLLRKL